MKKLRIHIADKIREAPLYDKMEVLKELQEKYNNKTLELVYPIDELLELREFFTMKVMEIIWIKALKK